MGITYAVAVSPVMLRVLVIVVLTALVGFVHAFLRLPKSRRDALLDLIRTLQGR